LFFDVLSFDPSLHNAILYACGSTIVCDSLVEARRLSGQEKQKVVTLDGTLIHKSGLMTGGLSGILEKAQNWERKQLEELKRTKDQCLKELVELAQTLKSVDQQQNLQGRIYTFDNKMKLSQADISVTDTKITNNNKDIKVLTKEIEQIIPLLKKSQQDIEVKQKELDEVNTQIHSTQDRVFKEFCKQVGVSNIREYEETSLTKNKRIKRRKNQNYQSIVKTSKST